MPASRHLIALAAWAACGCAGNPAPRGWLAPAREAQAEPFGAWIVLSHTRAQDLGGEFLAVDRDSVYLLSRAGEVLAFSVAGVREAKIAFYDAQWGALAAWTTVGALSTISNGAFLIFTFPLWTIGGPLITGGQSRAPIKTVDTAASWEAVRMYARFPAGLPENLPRKLPPKQRP
jgi:hypothetical protein